MTNIKKSVKRSSITFGISISFYVFLFIISTTQIAVANESVTEIIKRENLDFSSSSLEKLSNVIKDYVENEKIIGAEILVIHKQKTAYHDSFGWFDLEKKIPMTINCSYNIRSMTKPIIGVGIQMLIDSRKINLDDKVSKYIEGFNNNESINITIEQLLTHKSGLPTIIEGINTCSGIINLANKIGENGPLLKPNAKFLYSDIGCDVLAAIIEVVSELPFESYINQNILIPLGMEDTFFYSSKCDISNKKICSLYGASQHDWEKFWEQGDETLYPFARGSQSIYSTPMDYARFVSMLMNNGFSNDQRLLSEEAIDCILTPVSDMIIPNSEIRMPTGFPGYGVMSGQLFLIYSKKDDQDNKSFDIFGYNGSDGTYIWAIPNIDLMILYFTQSRGQTTWIDLEKQIYQTFIDTNFTTKNVDIPAKYKPYIGLYRDYSVTNTNSDINVVFENSSLAVDIPGQMIYELNEPDKNCLRTFKLTDSIIINFTKNDSGKVLEMAIDQKTTLLKKELSQISSNNDPFIGLYILPAGNGTFAIQNQENNLVLQDPLGNSFNLRENESNDMYSFEKDSSKAISFSYKQKKVISMNIHNLKIFKRINDE